MFTTNNSRGTYIVFLYCPKCYGWPRQGTVFGQLDSEKCASLTSLWFKSEAVNWRLYQFIFILRIMIKYTKTIKINRILILSVSNSVEYPHFMNTLSRASNGHSTGAGYKDEYNSHLLGRLQNLQRREFGWISQWIILNSWLSVSNDCVLKGHCRQSQEVILGHLP